MKFTETPLKGLWIVEPVPVRDERGAFMRIFCINEFGERGLETRFVQHSHSLNLKKHTLRGLHFQNAPHSEVKLVSCIRGSIWDVAIDIRPGSPTRNHWFAVELTAENQRQLYIPKGFAHGFQTLEDDTLVSYLISEFHAPDAASGMRYDEPAIGIEWPAQPSVISDRDLKWGYLAAFS
ncbi:dTDP-4-dehydrorhamnose 3,5-epimerase [Mesorhizobium sp. SB112]|uniref:dTDP-4-dehydrorhamnose 3,5-epimerase n=1 Tax=Mesorhizobium sp. SB112 TaxID=3151853 RepID=UPI003264BC65